MKFLLSLSLLILVGCTYSPSPSYWQEGWNEVKRQYDNATSWDELPYPWRIELSGKYWCTDQVNKYQYTTYQEVKKLEDEVKNFLKIVNEKRRQWYVNDHPELPAHTAECILAGQVHLGMTREQVIASIGHHGNKINRSVGEWGVHEQWIYGEYYQTYYYFENGILTSWQD